MKSERTLIYDIPNVLCRKTSVRFEDIFLDIAKFVAKDNPTVENFLSRLVTIAKENSDLIKGVTFFNRSESAIKPKNCGFESGKYLRVDFELQHSIEESQFLCATPNWFEIVDGVITKIPTLKTNRS